MAKILMHNPHTGGTGEVDADQLQQALADGLVPQQEVEMFNPATGGSGKIAPDTLAAATKDGFVPIGSAAHKQATTSKLESAARGVAQGLTFDFADEIVGGVESLFTDKTYQQARDESRANFANAQKANPGSFMAGQLGGGVASAFLPGIGAVGAVKSGATALQAAKAGTGAGALATWGASESDDLGEQALDAVKGGVVGGALGGGLNLAGKGLSAAWKTAGEHAQGAFDPHDQLALALGARRKELADPVVSKKFDWALDVARKRGMFDNDVGAALPPNRTQLIDRFFGEMDDSAEELHRLFNKYGDEAAVNVDSLNTVLENEINEIIQKAPPTVREAVGKEVREGMLADIYKTGGRLSDLWALKKETGRWVGAGWKKERPLLEQEIYMHTNQRLNDVLDWAVNNVAKQRGDKIGETMKALNERYGAAVTLTETLRKQIGDDKWQALVAGTRWRDWVAGNMLGSAAVAVTGQPGLIGMMSAAGAMANASFRSPQARILRARMGETAQAKLSALAQAQGKLPRTTESVQGLVREMLPSAQGFVPPEMLGRLQEIATAASPDDAGRLIKSLLMDTNSRNLTMLVADRLAPSKYKSEVDGRVFAPQDKELAAKEIRKMGYPPSVEAQKISKVHATGEIDPATRLPPALPEPPNYGDILEQFEMRIASMR